MIDVENLGQTLSQSSPRYASISFVWPAMSRNKKLCEMAPRIQELFIIARFRALGKRTTNLHFVEQMGIGDPPPYALEDACVNQDRYKNNNGDGNNRNIEFVFQSTPTARSRAEIPWEVIMHIHARDVSHLMRHGFYWDESNVQKEKGYIEKQDRTNTDTGGNEWEWARHYYLAHSVGDPQGWWNARLSVYTKSFAVLSRFRLKDLSVDKISKAFAWDARGRLIYFFGAHAPQDCINAYYDDRPMLGWWPQTHRK